MRSLNILFADDEEEIALVVGSVLRRAGNAVDVVKDGEAALAKLKEAPSHYHILITDANMPGITGIQVIQQLGQTGFRGKVVLLSGYLTEELEETYEGLPIDRIIQKPFSFADLNKVVKDLGEAIGCSQSG